MHRIRRYALCFCWTVIFRTEAAEAAPPIEGDASLLQVLREAQEANASRFLRGSLKASVDEVTPQTRFTAQAHLVWDGERTWWEYSVRHVDRERNTFHTSQDGIQLVQTPDELIWYNPALKQLQRILDKSSGYYRQLALRPDQSWFVFEGHPTTPWSEIFDPGLVEEYVERIIVVQEGDHVHVDRIYTVGFKTRSTVSLSQGANVVAYDWEAESGASGGFPYARSGKYEWAPDGNGRWRLASLRYQHHLPGQEDDPAYKYELTVDEFDPDPEIPSDRFTLEGLDVIPGTVIHETGPQGRAYQYGVSPEDDTAVSQEALDRLTEILRAGFSSPEREDLP